MVEFGPCIVVIWPNSVYVIQVITRILVKSFEKTQFKYPPLLHVAIVAFENQALQNYSITIQFKF